MSAKTGLVIIALAAALAQPGGGESAPTAPLPAPAAKVARNFLYAFAENDRDTISSLLPKELKNLYGPCPFARRPELSKPRADTRTGAIDFKGRMADPGLPSKGTIILRLVEEDGLRAWRVRQLYWYKNLPPEADIPDTSATAEDRRQEPAIRRATAEFIEAWQSGDYEKMDRLTFHWWEVPRDPPSWVKMNGADLIARPTQLDGLRVDFVAQLRVLRVIPKDVRGNLWLVQEEGSWRVRPLTFSFLF
ncbi:MAG TPA: hypothetical protein VMY87_04410 [Armatimonadota bacterium]|nr:hypothetical protein [Armatimonadota bacterium]